VAQDALVQSDQTVSLNLVQLYKALGGGWQNETNSIPRTAADRFSPDALMLSKAAPDDFPGPGSLQANKP